MPYAAGMEKRSGPVMATLFIILLLLVAGALIFALLNGRQSNWSTMSIWGIVLASAAVLAALALFGYYLGTSSSVDKFQAAYEKEKKKASAKISAAAASISTAAKDAEQWMNAFQREAGIVIDKDLKNEILANSKTAEQAKKAIQIANAQGNAADASILENAASVIQAKQEQAKAVVQEAKQETTVAEETAEYVDKFGTDVDNPCERWKTEKGDQYVSKDGKTVWFTDENARKSLCGK